MILTAYISRQYCDNLWQFKQEELFENLSRLPTEFCQLADILQRKTIRYSIFLNESLE